MKTTPIIIFRLAAALLSSCSSFQTAQVADYNRDGLVSDAEYRQYSKQKSVEASNVQVERMKRENAADTVNDVRGTLDNIHGIRNAFRAF